MCQAVKPCGLSLGGKPYFIKQHFGVGWAEIVKNLLSFKAPIIGAMTEVQRYSKIGTQLAYPTTPLVAYGHAGLESGNVLGHLCMTEDLGEITSLEDFCADWPKRIHQQLR
jgi:heptose I phosphotransferase